MIEIFAMFSFFASFLGMIFLIWRKIPVLINLPQPKESFWGNFKKKILELNPFKRFSLEIFLQKVLIKMRILSLKLDYKTFDLLKRLREKNEKKKKIKEDDYWDKIKRELKK